RHRVLLRRVNDADPCIEGLELVREIGRGGSAVVYEAVHATRGRVAVKVLTDDDPGSRAAFERECQLVGRVDHAAIVPIYELVTGAGGVLAGVMELVDG